MRRSESDALTLVQLGENLYSAGVAGRIDEFLENDLAFHRLLLQASGNDMFTHLGDVVAEVLSSRHQYGLFPDQPAEVALQWHVDVAQAVQRGKANKAFDAMLRIVERSLAESTEVFGGNGSGAADGQGVDGSS